MNNLNPIWPPAKQVPFLMWPPAKASTTFSGTHPSKGRSPHTHLIYKLELQSPEKNDGEGDEPPPVQEAMNIESEGSFVVQVRNS